MSIDEIRELARVMDLISNRCKIINQILGFTKVGCAGNPLQIVVSQGNVSLELCGCELGSFSRNDLDGASRMLEMIDLLKDGLWFAFRGGIIRAA